jgi:N-acetylglucosaminyl-diphospho-decaprenol L-rhamnosyltransferase
MEGQTEVLVVDNASSDGSIAALSPVYPFVRFISSPQNLGFSRANNLALQQAKGEFILFLNPDTILPENGLSEPIRFLESAPGSGACGLQMLDGSGHYLKESKRGFPGPWASFCKMFGLTKIFPSSRIFSGYYLGHLDPARNHEVEILSGAYMLVKKEVLDRTGGFDEQFFMYAEDIDLSYRILQSGFKNYYFAGTPLIHFKGESTRKDERYVKLFYLAMIQFVRKHYKGSSSFFYRKFLESGIRFRSLLSLARVKSKRPAAQKPAPKRLLLVGDPVSIVEAKQLLQAYTEYPIVKDRDEADTVIFCSGDSYSHSSLIQDILKEPKPKMFHCKSSSAIVGSHSSTGTGDIFHAR